MPNFCSNVDCCLQNVHVHFALELMHEDVRTSCSHCLRPEAYALNASHHALGSSMLPGVLMLHDLLSVLTYSMTSAPATLSFTVAFARAIHCPHFSTLFHCNPSGPLSRPFYECSPGSMDPHSPMRPMPMIEHWYCTLRTMPSLSRLGLSTARPPAQSTATANLLLWP